LLGSPELWRELFSSTKKLKKPAWSIPVSIALMALSASLGISPLLVAGASTKTPTMSVVPAFSSVPVGGGTDFTVYVKDPPSPPDDGGFRDLLPAFVVQSISQGVTFPNGTVVPPTTLVTCTTTATNKYPGYPSRGAETTCSGLYEQRVDPRAYVNSNTAIYFLGLVGFSPAGTYTITFVVTGLYFNNVITLTASAKLQVGTTTSGAAMASSKSPSISVVPALSSIPLNGTDDFTVYVQVPNNPPVSGTFYDLQPAFVVQSIAEYSTFNGTSNTPTTFITCSTSATNKYPGYPSRGAETSCNGVYEQRVDPRAYWGSNTGIWFLGFLYLGVPAGTDTETFIVTGLYYGNTITLTASASIHIG